MAAVRKEVMVAQSQVAAMESQRMGRILVLYWSKIEIYHLEELDMWDDGGLLKDHLGTGRSLCLTRVGVSPAEYIRGDMGKSEGLCKTVNLQK